jgi:hypothetical protein|tara:strand:+ start:104 stop:592 length:489 start_codon:yes stop_codon:yes gene_type:complete
MTSFLKSAKHVFDVESDLSYVEIVYDRYTRGKGYSTFTDYMNTEPLGDWVSIESDEKSILYEKFLDTMVKNTFEVRQRITELDIDRILAYKQNDRTYVRITHAVKILDPTFQPPRVNMESAWQMDFIKKFCRKYIVDIIQECTKKSRLEYFSKVLKLIELEQ